MTAQWDHLAAIAEAWGRVEPVSGRFWTPLGPLLSSQSLSAC